MSIASDSIACNSMLHQCTANDPNACNPTLHQCTANDPNANDLTLKIINTANSDKSNDIKLNTSKLNVLNTSKLNVRKENGNHPKLTIKFLTDFKMKYPNYDQIMNRIAWATSCFPDVILELYMNGKINLSDYVLCPIYPNKGRIEGDCGFERIDINPYFTETCQEWEFNRDKTLNNVKCSLKRIFREECHSKITNDKIKIVAQERERFNVVGSYERLIALSLVEVKNLNVLKYTPRHNREYNVKGQKVSSIVTGTFNEMLEFVEKIRHFGYKKTLLNTDKIQGYAIVAAKYYIKIMHALNKCMQQSKWNNRFYIYFKTYPQGKITPIGGSFRLKYCTNPRTKQNFYGRRFNTGKKWEKRKRKRWSRKYFVKEKQI